MYNPETIFRLASTILLVGVCSCLPEEHDERIDEEFDELDVSDPADMSTALGELPDEIDSNEAETAETSANSLQADFNGDGFADLAIGVPLDDPAGNVNFGSVNVLYGSASGVTATNDQNISRPPGSLSNSGETDEDFGWAVVAGHFNGDAFADLAIGVPHDDINGDGNAGSVQIFYGSAMGLVTTGIQILTEDTTNNPLDAEPNDNFGFALAVGDFDDDTFEDLAVGVPGEIVDGQARAGTVRIIFGSLSGLNPTDNQTWSQFTPGIEGVSEANDEFGTALAAGDFNDDGRSDLAIGVPGEDTGSIVDAGWINVLYGSKGVGLTDVGDDIWHQNITDIEGTAAAGDKFGSALAVGDFDHDHFDDVGVGVPGENVGTTNDAGAVNVIYGAAGGLTATGDQTFDQNTSGVEGTAEAGDRFGSALTAGDFDNDDHDDLAIGAPFDSVANLNNAGVVNVLYGVDSGLSASGDQLWTQDSPGIDPSVAGAEDNFGFALSIGDFDRDGVADLVIGVPGDDVPMVNEAGAVNVIYGSGLGLAAADNQLWFQNVTGVEGDSASGDRFGFAVR